MAKNKNQQVQPVRPTQQAHLVRAEYSVERRSGPLPDPQELAAYNQVAPGAADRIIKMAEAQSRHRIEIEKHVIHCQQGQVTRGQYFGLFAVIIVASCATYAAISGAQAFASVLGGTTVLGLATAFFGGKYMQKKDLSQKAKETPEPPA
jgi:uncharacterized membrane protein